MPVDHPSHLDVRVPPGAARQRLALDGLRPRALARALAAGSMLSLLGGQGTVRAQALPTGPSVVHGQARIETAGSRMTVSNTNNTIIDWNGFSIGAGASVRFDQPGATSQVLNRVAGSDPSSILGSLSSNGKVWLLNPHGVLFGQGARVDVAGLVTSTLSLGNHDWLAGRFNLSAPGSTAAAAVINRGELRTPLGGQVALIGGDVENQGVIEAPGGQVLLAAGRSVELVDTGAPNLSLRVTAPEGEALNLGSMLAAGGRIDVQAAVVNQRGMIRADRLAASPSGGIVLGGATDAASAAAPDIELAATKELVVASGSITSARGSSGGRIRLDSGSAGTTWLGGEVSVAGTEAGGGQVSVLGRHVGLVEQARIDASGPAGGGEVLVGGGRQGQDPRVANAQAVYIGPDAVLNADATARGDGGRLIVWSDGSTRALGGFTAQGGPTGGDGGFIETSGGMLDARPARVDASAARGTAGRWLLDPHDITITDDPSGSPIAPDSSGRFTSSASASTISSRRIVDALNAGTSVSVETGAGGTARGDINVTSATIRAAPPVPVSLALKAHGDITFSQSVVESRDKALTVELSSGNGSAGGSVALDATTITTLGGNITIGGTKPACGVRGCAPVNGASTDGLRSRQAGIHVGPDTSLDAGTGRIEMRGLSTATDIPGVQIAGDVRARDIDLHGWAGAPGQATGLHLSGGTVSATRWLSLTGSAIGDFSHQANPAGRNTGGVEISAVVRLDGDKETDPKLTIDGRVLDLRDDRFGIVSAGVVHRSTLEVRGGAAVDIRGWRDSPDTAEDARQAVLIQSASLFDFADAGAVSIEGNSTILSFGDIVAPTDQPLSLATSAGISLGGTVQGAPSRLQVRGGSVLVSGEIELSAPAAISLTAATSLSVDGSLRTGGAIVARAEHVVVADSAGFETPDDLTIVAPGSFSNQAADPFAVRRWNVYTGDPSSVSLGGLRPDFKQYDHAFASGEPILGTGNGLFHTLAPSVALSAHAVTRTYDGTLATGIAADQPQPAIFTGARPEDDPAGSYAASLAFIDKNAGIDKPLAVENARVVLRERATGIPVYGYRLDSQLVGTITPRALTVTADDARKRYGTRTEFAGSEFTVDGTLAGEAVTRVDLASAGAAESAPVDGSPYPITPSNATGPEFRPGNYEIRYVDGRLTIDPAALTVAAALTGNPTKVYDSTTRATLRPGDFTLSGFVNGDSAQVTETQGRYDSPNAGERRVSVALERSDFAPEGRTDLRNYVLPDAASGPGTIERRDLHIIGLQAQDKTYDADTAARIGIRDVSGLVGSESFSSASISGRFDSKDVGIDKPVTIGSVIGSPINGFDPRNYRLLFGEPGSATPDLPALRASINPAQLTVAASDTTKPYGQSRRFDGSEFTATGAVAGETVTRVDLASAGAAPSATVAGGPYPITPSNATGPEFDPRNYDIRYMDGRLEVVPAELQVAATLTGNPTKPYDASTAATLTSANFHLTGFVNGDDAQVTETRGRYDSPNAGNRTVSVDLDRGDFAPEGRTDLRNYALPGMASGPGTIERKDLYLIGLQAESKDYDGNTSARVGLAEISGLVGSERFADARAVARFDTKDAGTAKPVTIEEVAGVPGNGFNQQNYRLLFGEPGNASPLLPVLRADIRPAPLTVAANDASKPYNQTLTFSGTEFSSSGLAPGESIERITLQSNGAAAQAQIGNGPYPIKASGATGVGFDPDNYRIRYIEGRLTILPLELSIAARVTGHPTKVYDGTADARLAPDNFALGGFVNGDDARVTETRGRYDSPNAGSHTVSVALERSDFAPQGHTDLRNYVLPVLATGPGTIKPRDVTLGGAVVGNKVYDGGTAASMVESGRLNGVVDGEAIGLRFDARFESKDVGRAKPVQLHATLVDGTSGLAGNYRLAPAQAAADITPATLIYRAEPAAATAGGRIPPLGGAVEGFAPGETVASSTSGTLAFTTPASERSPAGLYPINGSGLSASNYAFEQGADNPTALRLAAPLAPVAKDTAQILTAATQHLSLPPAATSAAEGRTLDAVQALQPASSDKPAAFKSIPVSEMSKEALTALLASRDNLKLGIFSESIRQLEQDPALADVRECQNLAQLEQGTCLISDRLKAQIETARRLETEAADRAAAASADPPQQPASASSAATVPSRPTASAQPSTRLQRQNQARRIIKATLPQIARKVALLIGIDRYQDERIPQLDNSVKDVNAVGRVLEESLGYETIRVENGSKESIIAALNKLAAEVDGNDSVVVYYAGHGALVESTGQGYWQPSNASADKPETWISNSDISKLISRIGATQVALISDSCYSGTLVSSQRIRTTSQGDASRLLGSKSVVVMTSGGNEPVFDSGKDGHSPFAWNLMGALRQVASWQAGGNVFERVRFAVAREMPQKPQYGAAPGHVTGGDYLFEQRELERP